MGVSTFLGVLRFEGLLRASGGGASIVVIAGDSVGGVSSFVVFVFELRIPGALAADGLVGGGGVLPPRVAEFGTGAAVGWGRWRENGELD